MSNIIYELSYYIHRKCKKFAEDRISLSEHLYKYRGECKKDKMIEDCVIGTLGEWGAYYYLLDKGYSDISKPDMKIYADRRKSFSADLLNGDIKVHVKSQSKQSFEKYGASWLLQREDKITRDPDDNEYFIFTQVDGRDVEILGICKVKDIVKKSLFGECKIPWFQKTKVALYLDDLKGKIDLEVL